MRGCCSRQARPGPIPRWRRDEDPAPAEPSRFEWVCASVALLLGLLLRLLYVIRQPVNSDEPQHLHVAWGWAHGLVEYRDVYDNHTPLFHVLTAPLVWIVGDRPELFMWARLAMIPLWALTLVATYLAEPFALWPPGGSLGSGPRGTLAADVRQGRRIPH